MKKIITAVIAAVIASSGFAGVAAADDCAYTSYESIGTDEDGYTIYDRVCHENTFGSTYGPPENDYEPGELVID